MILSYKRITKALSSLHVCAGWSAPLLFPNLRRRGPYDTRKPELLIFAKSATTDQLLRLIWDIMVTMSNGPRAFYRHKTSTIMIICVLYDTRTPVLFIFAKSATTDQLFRLIWDIMVTISNGPRAFYRHNTSTLMIKNVCLI